MDEANREELSLSGKFFNVQLENVRNDYRLPQMILTAEELSALIRVVSSVAERGGDVGTVKIWLLEKAGKDA